ncbi:SARP family transcriptional regulator [Nocardia camponoti]|uniref:SARP family transcriptional regulator n=1 Tax=Nocardia camponoti TaxID=1616106 RepID=A0A917V8K1_9NOCA|nr:SARP family transcriptional regulator [Nocardia camponoti]
MSMQIAMLGPLEIRNVDGELIALPGARLRALLVALALEPGRAVSKAKLVDWIWGEEPPADAANALQALVSRLRRVLPDGSVDVSAGGYRLAIDAASVDASRFEQLLDAARGADDVRLAQLLGEACALWRGTPLQGLGENELIDAVVTRFENLHLAALEDRFEVETRLGRGAELVVELTELVARHPVRERLVASLMRALAAAGRGAEALTVYQTAREALADELGVDPSAELSDLHVAFLRGEVGGRPQERTTNLRTELASYVGKETDIAVVRELIARNRLTTLTGSGGSGKTRLAVETAHTMLADLPEGAWLVELTAVRGSRVVADAHVGPGAQSRAVSDIVREIAQSALAAIGLRDSLHAGGENTDPLDRLIAALRERETLLVLDNCEHVIDAAASFAHRILGECPRVRILATSREPLGITGEALWRVRPLELSAAVALLRDRAAAVGGAIAGADLATAERVCRALDGIPLAIELAAARLRTMSLDQLANRLDDRFRLLTGGSRTAIAQHRTLRAVVDWSWELLSDAERTVLSRLSVFAGSASVEAAERVCVTGDVEQWEVLDLLTALTDKSLLVVATDTQRFRMLETIRQYAADKLVESGAAESARAAHLAYFTELAASAEPHLRRAEQLEWLRILAADHDNITAAMRGALASGDATASLELAAAAGWYWWLAGYKSMGTDLVLAAARTADGVKVENRTAATVYGLVVHFMTSGRNDAQQVAEWIRRANEANTAGRGGHPALSFVPALERMLAGPDEFLPAFEAVLADDDPWVRALARLQLGKMRTVLGHDDASVEPYLTKALAEFRDLGERWGMSFALSELASRATLRGEFGTARDLFDEAIAAITEIGATEDIVGMRLHQARLHWSLGAQEASAAALDDAQRRAEVTGWPTALAEVALTRAELARWQGDSAVAREQLKLAETLLGDDAALPNVTATVHLQLGYLAEQPTDARTHLRAAYDAATAADYAALTAQVIVGIANFAQCSGNDAQATQLLGAANRVRGSADRANPDALRIEQQAQDRLGEPKFTEAMVMGSGADVPELVALTLASC